MKLSEFCLSCGTRRVLLQDVRTLSCQWCDIDNPPDGNWKVLKFTIEFGKLPYLLVRVEKAVG